MPGSEYAALLAHAGGVLYGTELGSVTLKRIGFFCFPIKHSTHTELGSVTLKIVGLFCFPIKHSTHTLVYFVFQLNTQHTRLFSN